MEEVGSGEWRVASKEPSDLLSATDLAGRLDSEGDALKRAPTPEAEGEDEESGGASILPQGTEMPGTPAREPVTV